MTTLADIRAAILAKMQGIANIGQVHSYERYSKQQSEFLQLYKTGAQILGWNLRRGRRAEISTYMGRTMITNEWEIKGFMSLDDSGESELAFDVLLEAIGDAFRDDITLGGVIETTIKEDGTAGIQLEDSGPVMFNGVLCHSARMKLNTIHYQ
jgi:hypothetical protein